MRSTRRQPNLWWLLAAFGSLSCGSKVDQPGFDAVSGSGGDATSSDGSTTAQGTTTGEDSTLTQTASTRGGCMTDGNGTLWTVSDLFAVPGRVIAVDTETLSIQNELDVPGVKGLSVDFDGYVWSVHQQSAHRVDPDTGEVVSYDGLHAAYTYSDMTGFALKQAGIPEG